jgi:hypothetical protein
MAKFEKGHKRVGGRVAGVPNRVTSDFRDRVLRSGLTPLDYMCRVFRDESEPTSIRLDAAAKVASFVYPRMSTVDVSSDNEQPMIVQILRFSPDEPKQLGQGGPMIAIDAVTGIAAEVVIEATDDDEEER